MPKFKTVITTVGAAKIAAVLAGTSTIVLDSNARMAVGDGNGTLPTPDPSQTSLVKEVYRAALNTASIDASNPKNIIAELIIPPDKGGFWMREMALYDAAGTLLAVGNMAETYKPSLSEGAGRKQVIRMVIAVSDVTAVTITMDSSTVMATQDYVDSKLSDHEKSRKHPDATLTEKGFTQLSSETDSASEAKAATPKAVKTVMDVVTTKAPTDSPALTGVPTAPTAPADTNSTQLATTAFVVAALARLVNSSPAVLDTLGELAAALGGDPNFATTMTTALANKQPLDATLTALAGLANSANKLPYFTGTDQMATADLSAFIRTMLGKSDAAAVLQYLGLVIGSNAGDIVTSGSKQPVYRTALTAIGYTGLPPQGLFADAPGTVDSVTKIATTLLNKSGQGAWTLGMSLGTYLGAGGTPDDLAHILICTDGAGFTRRFYFYNNGKIVGPNGEFALQDWVNTRLSTEIPVGVILAWPGATPPAGFLKCNGAGFTAAQYPKLAQAYPSLIVPDLRGEFLRGWDDGRNVDTGRAIMSAQGFAMQNITGALGEATESTGQYATEFHSATGAFETQSYLRNVMKLSAFEQRQSSASVSFDASRVAQTAAETRPRNIACNFIVRAL
ncbi:phage tail protein [Citrobacter freundii]|uniref:phage tail-collar fiber domain-containing protein n=1 Tax=Citrobacter freundii TaxID=546 RepID=UPI002B26D372|nr:phage tail protein [Citrobacter freundii]MEA8857454.1 phage tail protein [Citrobacter freundii]MEB1001348.1 phage tail protein [Citrobacter freundii]